VTYRYHAVTTLEAAIEALDTHAPDVHLMAGATAMVLLYRQGLILPSDVVGLRGIDTLRGIRALPGGGLEIGALTTHREIECSPLVRSYCAPLARAFGDVASIRVRNQATIGGNLVHADPAQDPPPMLIALSAEAELTSSQGVRMIPLDAFFLDFLETMIRPDEIMTSVRLPAVSPNATATWHKFLPDTGSGYATVSVATALRWQEDGSCLDLRIALGGVGSTPVRARALEQALEGGPLTLALIRDAVDLLDQDIDPLDDPRGSSEYKRRVARVWVRRALEASLGQRMEAAG
jgi:carbon-monoxide dehydrogenase medium subunit